MEIDRKGFCEECCRRSDELLKILSKEDKMFWNNSKKRTHEESVDTEQAVIVSFDTEGDISQLQKDIGKLTDHLEDKLDAINSEYDGDEYGDDECNLYFYGPNAEKIYELVLPSFKNMDIRPIRFLLRFGDVHDKSAKEEHRRLV